MKNLIKKIIKEELQRLNEIKSLDAYNQYYKGLVDKENQEKDLSTYNQIVRLDPTFIENTENLGQYTKWLFRKDNLTWILNNIKTRRGEDLYKIKEALSFFEKAKKINQLPIDKKDINKLNIDTLFDLTFQLQNQNLQSNTEKEKETKKDSKKVFENDEWLIVVPETEEAACYYGKGTKWCTAGNTNNQFDYYNRQGTLYILINKQDQSEKFQFHFESKQFMDVMDRSINIGDFFGENDDIYNFFKNIQGDELDFILAESSVENGDTESFDYFYTNNFSDGQKRSLIGAAFERDSNSDGYYTVTHVLSYVTYQGMEKDFRSNFLYGLENSLGDRYDDENYNAKLFIDMIGGFTYENIDDIINQIDFKDTDEIEKIFEIAEEYDNGLDILNRGLQENDKQINQDLLDTLVYLQDKFFYSRRNKLYSSKLAQVKINKITDFQKGLLNITFIPKDSEGNPIGAKKLTGDINYKNLIKYLTIPQIPLNESKKKSIIEKVTKTKVICDNCGWSWNIKDGGKDPYVCHKCGHDNNPKKLNEKCWKGYTQKGMKAMFGKRYPNCIKITKEELQNYTEGEYAKILIFLSDLYVNEDNMDSAYSKKMKSKIKTSKTKLPLEVYRMLDGSKFLIDGHHRIADIIYNIKNKEEWFQIKFKANVFQTNTSSVKEALKSNLYKGYIPFREWSKKIILKEQEDYNPITKSEDYSKWKRNNVTLRGIKELGKPNEVYGSFGKGLYTVPLSNKSMARQYGDVYFVVNAIPKNPKVVQNLNDAEILRYKLVDNYCKENNVNYSLSFFENNTSMDIEMIKLGYDGLIIKGREMVNYKPNNIKYFRTENELERYHERL